MSITSNEFLLLFLPICFLIYWFLARGSRQKLWVLFAVSMLFYAISSLPFLPLLIGLSLVTFWAARHERFRLAIVLNLLALALFKYWNFGIDNLNALAASAGVANNGQGLLPLLDLALPLGISFYVFKHIGYLIDVWQKSYTATDDLLSFVTFSAFFPQITAGPLSNYAETEAQYKNLPARLDMERFYSGAAYVSVGLCKKLLIADSLGLALKSGLFDQPATGNGLLWAWFSLVTYALQLYFDFTSYTDIALGIGIWFGVSLPPNFNDPYLATNPRQFWQRWHISLSNWFRLYFFSPVSRRLIKRWGLQHSERAQFATNMLTMTLIGLWHGATWGFIAWGVYHGLLLNVHAGASRRKIGIKWTIVNRVLLLLAVLVGWTFFLSPNFAFWQHLMGGLIGLQGRGRFSDLQQLYSPLVIVTVLVAIGIVAAGIGETSNLLRKIGSPNYPSLVQSRQLLVISMILIFVALSLLVMATSSNTVGQPFIYALF